MQPGQRSVLYAVSIWICLKESTKICCRVLNAAGVLACPLVGSMNKDNYSEIQAALEYYRTHQKELERPAWVINAEEAEREGKLSRTGKHDLSKYRNAGPRPAGCPLCGSPHVLYWSTPNLWACKKCMQGGKRPGPGCEGTQFKKGNKQNRYCIDSAAGPHKKPL